MKIPCPRCGQDWLQHAIIKPIGREIYICEECFSLWEENVVIAVHTPKYFFRYENWTWEDLEFMGNDLSNDIAYETNPLL